MGGAYTVLPANQESVCSFVCERSRSFELENKEMRRLPIRVSEKKPVMGGAKRTKEIPPSACC